MNGLKIRGVTLFIGNIPNRKQLCFYFQEGNCIYPIAYVRKEYSAQAIRLWKTMLGENDDKGVI
jgi:hypothetical protein